MEMIREIVPFIVGFILLPPVVMLLSRLLHIERWNIALSFILAILIGCCVSFFAGELTDSLPEGLMAIIVDTSLIYTGSQAAYRLWWKPLLAHRLARRPAQAQIS